MIQQFNTQNGKVNISCGQKKSKHNLFALLSERTQQKLLEITVTIHSAFYTTQPYTPDHIIKQAFSIVWGEQFVRLMALKVLTFSKIHN